MKRSRLFSMRYISDRALAAENGALWSDRRARGGRKLPNVMRVALIAGWPENYDKFFRFQVQFIPELIPPNAILGHKEVRDVRTTRLLPIGARSFQIQVEGSEGGGLCGLVSGGGFSAPVAFSSLTRLIVLLEHQMDLAEDCLPEKSAPVNFNATLELEILFRQNHSWQGRLRWLPGQQEVAFHSVLELILLIVAIFADG